MIDITYHARAAVHDAGSKENGTGTNSALPGVSKKSMFVAANIGNATATQIDTVKEGVTAHIFQERNARNPIWKTGEVAGQRN